MHAGYMFCNWHSFNAITEPPSMEYQDLFIPHWSMRKSWEKTVRISVHRLFQGTKAAQKVAIEGIWNRNLLQARQALGNSNPLSIV